MVNTPSFPRQMRGPLRKLNTAGVAALCLFASFGAIAQDDVTVEELQQLLVSRDGQIASLREALGSRADALEEARSALAEATQTDNSAMSAADISQLEAELADANSRLKAASMAFGMFEQQADADKAAQAAIQAELDDANSRLKAAAMAFDSYDLQVSEEQGKVAALQAELDDANSRLKAAAMAFDSYDLQVSEEQGKVAALQAELDDANSRLKAAAMAFDSYDLQVSEEQGKVAALQAELDDANSRLKAASMAFDSYDLQVSEEQGKSAALQAELDDANSRLKAAAMAFDSYDLQVSEEQGKSAVLQAELDDLVAQSNTASDTAIALLRTVEQQLQDNGVEGAAVTLRDDNAVVVALESSSLFRSGRGNLSADGRDLIQRVAKAVSPLSNDIIVEGHTDSEAVVGALAAAYPTNWELSVARAASAVSFMESNGVDPNRMSARGFGQYRPIASNDTVEGRAANRRVDVVLLP